MVVFDEEQRHAQSLTFEQPTRWLAAQLPRDPDLWNRSWAIDQLARRTGIRWLQPRSRGRPAVRTTLSPAPGGGGTGGFPEPVAVPPLEAAARDTSSAVREAAI